MLIAQIFALVLIIAVMFTFSFGTAMAATHKVTSTTEATTLAQAYKYAKSLVATNYAKAYEEAVEVNLGYEVSKADWDAIATQAAVEGFLAEKYNKAMNEFDDAWTALDYKHLAAAVFASSQDTRLSVGGNAVVSEYASYGADTAQVVVTAIKNVLINEFGVEVALRAYEADRQEVLSAFDKVNYAAYSDKVDPAVGNTQKLTYRQEAEEIVKAAKKATAEVGYFTTDTYTELVNGNLAAILNSIKTATTEFSIFGGANVKGVAYYLEKEMYKGYETGNYLVKAVKTSSAVEGEDAADAATIAANKAKIAKIYANYVATNNANKDWADAWKTVADFLAEQEALPAGWLDALDTPTPTLGSYASGLTTWSKAIDYAKELVAYGDKYAAEKDGNGAYVRDAEDVADEVEVGTLNIYNVLFTTGLESEMISAKNVAEARILALSISDDASELAFKKESIKTILNDELETVLDDYYPLEADMVKAAYEEVLAKVEAAKSLAAVPTVNLPAKAVKKNVVDGYCTYTTGTPEAAALAAVKAYVDYANSAKTALDGTYIPWDTNAQDTAKDLIEEIYGEAGART